MIHKPKPSRGSFKGKEWDWKLVKEKKWHKKRLENLKHENLLSTGPAVFDNGGRLMREILEAGNSPQLTANYGNRGPCLITIGNWHLQQPEWAKELIFPN